MYCRKCRYVSFDHLAACPKCGQDWAEEKKKLGIEWLSPGEKAWLDPSLMKAAGEDRDEGLMPSGEEEFAFAENEETPDKEPEYFIKPEEELETRASAPAGPGSDQQADQEWKPADSGLDKDIDFTLDFSDESEEKAGSAAVDTAVESETAAEPKSGSASDLEPDLDTGLEPDLDFSEEAVKEKKADALEQEYEIDYPDLEFIESREKEK